MTLETIIEEVRGELQESTASEWSAAELTAYVNEAIRIILQLCGWFHSTDNLVPVVGQQDYTLPSDYARLLRVAYDRDFLPQTTQSELDRDVGNWRGYGNDTPRRFFLKQQDTLILWPKPDAAGTTVSFDSELGVVVAVEDPTSTPDPDVTFDSELGIVIAMEDTDGGQVRFLPSDPLQGSAELGVVVGYTTDEANVGLIYEALPETLSADDDVPQLPLWVQPAIVPYTVFRALRREGPHQDIPLSDAYFSDFADWMSVVLEKQGRQWPEGGKNLEPVLMGNTFIRRLDEIGQGHLAGTQLRAHYE